MLLREEKDLDMPSLLEGEFSRWKGRRMVSNNNLHVAVMGGGRIYDAYTDLQA